MLLDFDGQHCVGTCSTQLTAYQRVQIFGTRGRLDIEIPFNAPPDRPCRIFIDAAGVGAAETLEFDTCDQYTLQGDLFSKAILDNREVPVPLEDALANMECIEAVFRSAESGRWEEPHGAVLTR